jgi:hypothetical protein
MTGSRTAVAVLLAALAALAAGAAGPAAARADTTSHLIAVDQSPLGGPGAGGRTAHIRARVAFPSDWTRRGRDAATVRLRERTRGCRYDVTARARVVTAVQPDSAAYALDVVPAAERRSLLDDGRRGVAAWRVAKLPGSDRVRLRGVWAAPARDVRALRGAPAGLRAFDEIAVDATAVAGDSCPTGNYRDVVGPEIGDALATARFREFLD